MYRLPYTVAASRSTSLGRQAPLVVFVAALAWLGAFGWMRPLALPDEGRYVGVAWEMFRSGDWVTPTLDGLPFLHKPPLFYWITAAAMHLLGPGDWAVRTAPILAGATTVAILYATLRRWLGEVPARMAAGVLATQPLFFGGSQFANMDMLVSGCISAAILFGARAALASEAAADRRDDLTGAYIAAALGVLAKGLIGLVIPALVLLIWLALVRRWRTVRALLWLPGLAMFTVIVAPWFVAVQLKHPGFFHYFFVVQHLQRFAGGGFNSVQPFWFYLPVLLLFTLPWPLWLLVTLRRATVAPSSRPRVVSLMGVWLGVVLVFFSIPQSKLIGYVLPALVPFAVLMALGAEPLVRRSARAQGFWRASTGVAAATCVAVTVGFAVTHPKSSRSLAMAMMARHAHGGVAFIDEYRYDLPFYLRETAPVRVLADWSPAEVRQHDNWRKEMADAGSFAPEAATTRLIDEAGFRADLCGGRIRWVMARVDSVRRYPYLGQAQQVATELDSALWQIDAADPTLSASIGCDKLAPASAVAP